MAQANCQATRLIAITLMFSLLSSLPSELLAECMCGNNCGCGASCQCQLPLEPPPRNPKANRVRKNINALTAEERHAFVNAILTLKKTYRSGSTISIYDEYVRAHYMGMMAADIHEGPVFFPWHRCYLDWFERALQVLNPSVTIPYWDFTVPEDLSIMWSEDFMGGSGDFDHDFAVMDGPFRQGRWSVLDGPYLQRQFGGPLGIDLPTRQDVEGGFLISQYDAFPFTADSPIDRSFRNYMTGWNWPTGEPEVHNRVHVWVGGTMYTMASPGDPAFFPFHAYIDCLWVRWQRLNGNDTYPETGAALGHNLRDPMYCFRVTPENVFDHHALGYCYDIE